MGFLHFLRHPHPFIVEVAEVSVSLFALSFDLDCHEVLVGVYLPLALSSGDVYLDYAENRPARQQSPLPELIKFSAVNLVGQVAKSVGIIRTPLDFVELRNELRRYAYVKVPDVGAWLLWRFGLRRLGLERLSYPLRCQNVVCCEHEAAARMTDFLH
eukprot:7569221-Pyramimonas_sp.AAC.1